MAPKKVSKKQSEASKELANIDDKSVDSVQSAQSTPEKKPKKQVRGKKLVKSTEPEQNPKNRFFGYAIFDYYSIQSILNFDDVLKYFYRDEK